MMTIPALMTTTNDGTLAAITLDILCRCWIWLMMGLVVLTFIMMVMTMRLFRKKLPPPVVYESATPAPPPVSSSIRAEL